MFLENAGNSVKIGIILETLSFLGLLRSLHEREITIIDRDLVGAFPEHLFGRNINNIEKIELYRDFYFNSRLGFMVDEILERNKGIIMLHNSWTPEEFKFLSEKDFLETKVLLAQLLKNYYACEVFKIMLLFVSK